jgi:hypothetical protein
MPGDKLERRKPGADLRWRIRLPCRSISIPKQVAASTTTRRNFMHRKRLMMREWMSSTFIFRFTRSNRSRFAFEYFLVMPGDKLGRREPGVILRLAYPFTVQIDQHLPGEVASMNIARNQNSRRVLD